MSRYPKPDDERVNRVPPVFGWTDLPREGRKGKAPTLPPLRKWSPQTRKWWGELWAKPQATQWDQSGSSLVGMAVLFDEIATREVGPGASSLPALLAEMRQHEDRHGLTPKAMLQLRWRIPGEEGGRAMVPSGRPKAASDRRARALKVISGAASA